MPDALRQLVYSWPATEGALQECYAFLDEEWRPWSY
jgi:hypothetical protein